MKSKFMVYACGGCGANLIQGVIDVPHAAGYAKMDAVMVDTSNSNIQANSNIPSFLIPGLSGTGKNRASAYAGAQSHMVDVLNSYKPGDTNVVIFSASGGSGSIIGGMLVGELLARGEQVFTIVVSSVTSGKEAANSYNTMRSLQNLAKVHKRPVPIIYHQNCETDLVGERGSRVRSTRTSVDEYVGETVRSLALLTSEQHSELDKKDVNNWVDYHQVTSIRPQLVEVIISYDNDDFSLLDGNVVSSASLMTSVDSEVPSLRQPYACEGYYKDDMLKGDQKPVDIHFMLTPVFLPDEMDHLKSISDDYAAAEERLNNFRQEEEEACSENDGLIL